MKKLLCVLLTVVLLTGCTREKPPVQKSIFAMDTIMDIQIWGSDGETAAGDVEKMLYTLESRWSATRPDSLTAALNRGESPDMTAQEQALFSQIQALKDRTGGNFNPNLRAVSEAWGFHDKNYRIPSQSEIDVALAQSQWDMGAALKGYAGDRAVEILKQYGVDRAVLNLGGNIQTYGTKPDGQPWQIAIQNPLEDGVLGVLSVEGTMSIVTSGSYQRYFEKNGAAYHHIMDGKTGRPADSGLVSVTVICKSGLTADALSTALFVMGLEEGSGFWRESSDFEAVFVLTDGTVYATQGAELSGCEYKEIQR